MTLTFEKKEPCGKPDSLVMFFHGYGSDGEDLITLGSQWSSVLPTTVFIAPNAPKVCGQNPGGFEWTCLRDWNPMRLAQELKEIRPTINTFIDECLREYDLGYDRLALVGFSQGVFVSLDVALHRPRCAGVLGYSGGFMTDPADLIVGRPPVLLLHGDQDTVLLPDSTVTASEQLKNLNVDIEHHILPGLDHGIDAQGLGMGASFLKKVLAE